MVQYRRRIRRIRQVTFSIAAHFRYCTSQVFLINSFQFAFCCGFKATWWEVDLGEGVKVSSVTIYNRNDKMLGQPGHATLVSSYLSNSNILLLNYQNIPIKTYHIGDATDIPVFNISIDKFFDSPKYWIYIYTDFSTMPVNAILGGAAFVANGECVLTPNLQDQQGYLLFDSLASAQTAFHAQWGYRVHDGIFGADGISFNYGPMDENNLGMPSESGMKSAILVVSFIEYWLTGSRVELTYNGTRLATEEFQLMSPGYRRVVVGIDASNFITISVGSTIVISTNITETGYGNLDKTRWRFGFAGRTGSDTNKHSIDYLAIGERR